jgi:hypothetical protein
MRGHALPNEYSTCRYESCSPSRQQHIYNPSVITRIGMRGHALLNEYSSRRYERCSPSRQNQSYNSFARDPLRSFDNTSIRCSRVASTTLDVSNRLPHIVTGLALRRCLLNRTDIKTIGTDSETIRSRSRQTFRKTRHDSRIWPPIPGHTKSTSFSPTQTNGVKRFVSSGLSTLQPFDQLLYDSRFRPIPSVSTDPKGGGVRRPLTP